MGCMCTHEAGFAHVGEAVPGWAVLTKLLMLCLLGATVGLPV